MGTENKKMYKCLFSLPMLGLGNFVFEGGFGKGFIVALGGYWDGADIAVVVNIGLIGGNGS